MTERIFKETLEGVCSDLLDSIRACKLTMILYMTIAFTFIVLPEDSTALISRVIGGNDAWINDHPYMVSIQYDGRHKCGGSILSQNYILTAAHCLPKKYNLEVITIRSGTSFKQQNGTVHRIDKHFRHNQSFKKSDGRYINDIAVAKITPPFVLDETRQPIKLFNSNETIEPGTMAIVSGWGKTRKNNWNGQLQSVAVPVLEQKLCTVNQTGVLCASFHGIGGKDACLGDSGGPLVIDGRQAGIVSWGMNCAKPWYPGVYTEVAYFREWIDEHMDC